MVPSKRVPNKCHEKNGYVYYKYLRFIVNYKMIGYKL